MDFGALHPHLGGRGLEPPLAVTIVAWYNSMQRTIAYVSGALHAGAGAAAASK